MKTILIVDDEAKIRDVVASYLQKENYRTLEAATGREALEHLNTSNPQIDLCILDLMLPDISGEEVCRQIRRTSALPILMLTAKVTEDDRIAGLSLGADDYLSKPFSPRELVARVKAILRRSSEHQLLADRVEFDGGALLIDTVKHEVYRDQHALTLTPNEYKLLLVLARHPLRTFTRDELVEKVLGFDFEGDPRTIDQHMKNLRQKLESDPKSPRYLVTVYGIGYKFAGGDSA
ncbi:response regulator transcription factor [Tumebacillus permanentifrigoris]|uniref:DNA-binding response OmpR family regulator n=1 Tax=Tumebacillus permanentifrigoris TaxID=378543 RepID=A0A316D6S4_9BACL|nr:response regulator transcription factor [Tumebacillus permanentifrigoris]PWK11235.1 DNA-binding response OmpR family regulator [Tumebacillus permanentifrigoris]